MSKFKVLLVDDDELVHDTFRLSLPEHWELISQTSPQVPTTKTFHAAFVDMHLTGNLDHAEGLEFIGQLAQHHPQLEIVAISGDLDRDLMEGCLKKGAGRFLAKPLSGEELVLVLEKIEALWQMRGVGGPGDLQRVRWIGESQTSQDIQRFVSQMAGERTPILLEGESGTGKEVIAQLLNQQNPSSPFVAVNVAAIPSELFESEFFGHVKGAFTGAIQSSMGYAEQAHGGDLFLDEIEALPLVHQAKLLRFLESGEFKRVGAKNLLHSQTRIIAATNENLKELVSKEKFREDLLYRLSGHHFIIPPLRERESDIPLLCDFFAKQQKPHAVKEFAPEAIQTLSRHSWPGNVRELKRVVEQLCVLAPLPIIRAEDVRQILFPLLREDGGQTLDLDRGLPDLLAEYEKNILAKAIESTDDVDEMAKLLKISRSSFYKKVKDHGLELKK
jgi:DNA-binding NtrC family response regulator